MRWTKALFLALAFFSCLLSSPLYSEALEVQPPQGTQEPPPPSKLVEMHRLFYLPFSLEFREGSSRSEALPFISDDKGAVRMLTLSEWQAMNEEWSHLRAPWAKQVLLLSTQVPPNGAVHISDHLISHHISLSRRAFDKFPLADRIALETGLRSKSIKEQREIRQLGFVKSFLSGFEDERFNFLLISASWCASCQEYRVLLETYARMFPERELNIHSVVIEDPRSEIFNSRLMDELFPDQVRHPGDTVPRFLAIQKVQGKLKLWQEGEAIRELLRRYFDQHRGFLDGRASLFQPRRAPTAITVER